MFDGRMALQEKVAVSKAAAEKQLELSYRLAAYQAALCAAQRQQMRTEVGLGKAFTCLLSCVSSHVFVVAAKANQESITSLTPKMEADCPFQAACAACA